MKRNMMRVSVGDILVSNEGKGHLRAKVLEVLDFTVRLVRWPVGTRAKNPRKVAFSLPRYLLENRRTGWRLAAQANPLTTLSQAR